MPSLLKKALEKEIVSSTPNTIDRNVIYGGLLIQRLGDLTASYYDVARYYVLSKVCKNTGKAIHVVFDR